MNPLAQAVTDGAVPRWEVMTLAGWRQKESGRGYDYTAYDRLRWWQRFGFDPFDAEDSTNLNLYLLSEDIAATLSASTLSAWAM